MTLVNFFRFGSFNSPIMNLAVWYFIISFTNYLSLYFKWIMILILSNVFARSWLWILHRTWTPQQLQLGNDFNWWGQLNLFLHVTSELPCSRNSLLRHNRAFAWRITSSLIICIRTNNNYKNNMLSSNTLCSLSSSPWVKNIYKNQH